MELTIVVFGAGGVGRAVALMLAEQNPATKICLVDIEEGKAEEAAEFVHTGSGNASQVHSFHEPNNILSTQLNAMLSPGGIILDCLPGAEAPRIARLARDHGMHYANLTEYVAETEAVLEIAQGAETAFVVQCGLAPGYIDVAAKALTDRACDEWGISHLDRVVMRVGALSMNAGPPSYYAWTWSPVGVAKEYLEDAIVIREGKARTLPSLSCRGLRTVRGITYEEALTSGGAADLPIALEGRVTQLDYMTLRWPGHYDYVERILANIPIAPGREVELQNWMEKEVPAVEEDLVVLYVAVEGTDKRNVLRRLEHSAQLGPATVGRARLRAIQATTAASLAEVTLLVAQGGLAGPVLQSQLPTKLFLDGHLVRSVYGSFPLNSRTATETMSPLAGCPSTTTYQARGLP